MVDNYILVYSMILGYIEHNYGHYKICVNVKDNNYYGHYKVCVNVNNNYLVSMLCSWFILCRHLQFHAKADNVNINIYFAFSVY